MADEGSFPRFPSPFWHSESLEMARFEEQMLKEMVLPGPRTVLERKLDSLTSTIRQKSNWWVKIFQSDVVEHWRAEAAQQDVDSAMFDFAVQVASVIPA